MPFSASTITAASASTSEASASAPAAVSDAAATGTDPAAAGDEIPQNALPLHEIVLSGTSHLVRTSYLLTALSAYGPATPHRSPSLALYPDWAQPARTIAPATAAEAPAMLGDNARAGDGIAMHHVSSGPVACVAGSPDPLLLARLQNKVVYGPPVATTAPAAAPADWDALSLFAQRTADPQSRLFTNYPPPRFAAIPDEYRSALPLRARYMRHGHVEVFVLPLGKDPTELPLVDQLFAFRRPHAVVSHLAPPPPATAAAEARGALSFFGEPVSGHDLAADTFVSPRLLSDNNFLLFASSHLTPAYYAACATEAMSTPPDAPLLLRPAAASVQGTAAAAAAAASAHSEAVTQATTAAAAAAAAA